VLRYFETGQVFIMEEVGIVVMFWNAACCEKLQIHSFGVSRHL
jgi:hypothetical protein